MGLLIFNLMFATYSFEYEYNNRYIRVRAILSTPMVEMYGPWQSRPRQDHCPRRWAPQERGTRWDRE